MNEDKTIICKKCKPIIEHQLYTYAKIDMFTLCKDCINNIITTLGLKPCQ